MEALLPFCQSTGIQASSISTPIFTRWFVWRLVLFVRGWVIGQEIVDAVHWQCTRSKNVNTLGED